MKPPPFELLLATSVTEAVGVLAADDGAKVLAGGQSLVPLLALRLARPTVLVDVNGLGLDGIDVVGDEVVLGALVRHRRLERDATVRAAAPLLAQAAALVGHPAIRHRGTLGGSLAHADPVAELPAALLALGGSVVVEGPDGRRTVRADHLFEGFLTTSISPDELLVEVRVPAATPSTRTAFCEWAPRSGDFAVAGIALVVDDSSVRAAACGIGTRPIDVTEAFEPVLGSPLSDALVDEVVVRVRALCAGDEDKAQLAGILAARALREVAA
ncbi:MAG: molybdopterin dehydrogenase FAD-binding protein [Actinomycetia bacterium]|nr:molybdopterin dehydrogenase FAD-binding protein [Actinomycetes bacterium]